MQATVVSEADKLVLRVTGSLSFTDSREWRILVEDMLDKDATSHILDITALEMVDSAGLGMMLTMKKWAEDRNRKMKLRFDNASVVGGMVRLAKFDGMFDSEER